MPPDSAEVHPHKCDPDRDEGAGCQPLAKAGDSGHSPEDHDFVICLRTADTPDASADDQRQDCGKLQKATPA